MTNEQLTRLEELFAWADTITDALGHPIESGVIEGVVLLNALGFRTLQSCEGHVDWGQGVPWIMLGINDGPSDPDWYQKSDKAMRRAVEEKVHDLRFALVPYLESFYRERIVPFEQRLTLTEGSTFVEIIPTIGQSFLSLSLEVRQQRLGSYQGEMVAFIGHLRVCYLAMR